MPTDYPAESYTLMGLAGQSAEEQQKQITRFSQFASGNTARLQRAVKAGVPIAFGSDEYYQFPGKTRGEASHLTLHAYQAAGMSPLQVIQAATLNAAELLGWQMRIGTIESGKLADIIAVEGNPLVWCLRSSLLHRPRRGARMARREEGEYREYATDLRSLVSSCLRGKTLMLVPGTCLETL